MSDLSYLCTPQTSPYKYKSIIQVFSEITTLFPNKEILIYRGIDGTRESLTCCQLQTQATKLARYLIGKGVKKGDSIALFGPNSLEWAIAELAIIMAGGVVVHVPFSIANASDAYEIALIAECKVFLIDPGRRDEYLNMIFQLKACIEKNDNCSKFVLLRKSQHSTSFDDLQRIFQLKKEIEIEFPTLYPEDEIAIFATSGSTGNPKMITKTHFHATKNVMTSLGKVYLDRPFAWAGGSPIFTVYQGKPVVFCDSSVATEGRNTMEIWESIKEEQCKSAAFLPYFLSDLVAQAENYKDSFKLDMVTTTGQLIDNIHTKVIGIFTKVLTVAYGLTEAGMVSLLPPMISAGDLESGDVGKPLPGREVKIIDGDGNVLRKHENGELCIRSLPSFESYYKGMGLTDEAILPGKWFRSGDIAHINENNHIIIKGRIKDCISRGTRKILPSSIENVITTMNGIRDVNVIGVPDRRLYEEICVYYVSDPEHDILPTDVKEMCLKKFLWHDAIDGIGEMPKHFLRFHSLPMLGNGKIDKRQLRIDAIQQLGLVDQMKS